MKRRVQMSNMRVAISLIDEHDDDCVLSTRILNDIWTVIAENNDDLKTPSNLFIDEVAYILTEKISQNLIPSIRSMIEELMVSPKMKGEE